MKHTPVRALTFDVFGTVTDWRSTIIREGEALGRRKGLDVDWPAFALAWRAGYQPAMQRVRSGALPWTNIDALHRMVLDELLVRFSVTGLGESEIADLNRVWHRLDPWPDAREGLERLRLRYTVATLSNGNMALLTNMAKHAGLRWDCILSAELVQHYKPDPRVYGMAASWLGLEPAQVMMVAAHNGDLRAARTVGMRTAFVYRRQEYGPGQSTDLEPDAPWDVIAEDLLHLADLLVGADS